MLLEGNTTLAARQDEGLPGRSARLGSGGSFLRPMIPRILVAAAVATAAAAQIPVLIPFQRTFDLLVVDSTCRTKTKTATTTTLAK
jgi:hypothetical protein